MGKWWITVGIPGGEYAVKAEDLDAAWRLIWPAMGWSGNVPEKFADVCNMARAAGTPVEFKIRPCPPDLVEWIETEMHKWHHIGDSGGWSGTERMKVEGGWRWREWESANEGFEFRACTTDFIPVPLTANLTIIQEPPHDH